jgi:hypothetical protein
MPLIEVFQKGPLNALGAALGLVRAEPAPARRMASAHQAWGQSVHGRELDEQLAQPFGRTPSVGATEPRR